MILWIASIACFISIFIFLSGLLLLGRKQKVIDKLSDYDEEQVRIIEKRMSNEERKGPIKKISLIFGKFPSSGLRRRKNRLLFRQADMPITYEELLVIKIMAVTSIGLLVYAVSRNIVTVLLFSVLIWISPNFFIKKRKSDKIKGFDEQLNEGLVMISNALKAGYSFLQALAVAADETQDPFATEFKFLLKELSLGIPLEDGLANLSERVPSEDLKLIVNAILIQKDVGGNLSEILENIGETIRERQRIKNEVKTLTAQGKLSGIIIMVMPFFLGSVIYLFDNAYILSLFSTVLGRIMLGTAIVSQFLGWLFIRKIINIEY
jgi:Flp pilus assembly protein TadB